MGRSFFVAEAREQVKKEERRLHEIFRRLRRRYGFQGWWPIVSSAGRAGRDSLGYRTLPGQPRILPRQRLEIVVGTILTQNTAWENARLAILSLEREGLLTSTAIRDAGGTRLGETIRSSGYYNQKARKLAGVVSYLEEGGFLSRRGNTAPPRDELLSQWGVGPETADSILLYAFAVPRFVIDAYTLRIFGRMGLLGPATSYGEAQSFFESRLAADADEWGELHALIVRHAKEYCRTLPLCAECPLLDECAFGWREKTPHEKSE